MSHFQQLLALKPFPFTYIGIGSNPHVRTLGELTDTLDQLIPCFVRETRLQRRVIHFDPAFDKNMTFIREYFITKYPTLVYQGPIKNSYHSWTSPTLEVLIVPECIQHMDQFHPENDDWFLEQMSEKCLNHKLVVQDYSGQELLGTLRTAFKKTSDPVTFKKNILFDITYGDASCMTDMAITRPIYDKNNNFINFTLYDDHEMLEVIGLSPELDRLIKRHFVKKFKSILNHHHVNYRRRVQGDTCLMLTSQYNDTTEPAFIMAVLQKELVDVFTIFHTLGLINEEKQALITHLMVNYTTYNMYDWNTQVNKLFV